MTKETQTTEKPFDYLDTWTNDDNKSMCPYCMKEHNIEEGPTHEGHEVEQYCPECEKEYTSVGFVQTVSKTSRRHP